MNHTVKFAAAWLMASLNLAGCQEEPRVTVSYACEQGHTHREVVPARKLADGSVVASVPAGKQIECLPKGGER